VPALETFAQGTETFAMISFHANRRFLGAIFWLGAIFIVVHYIVCFQDQAFVPHWSLVLMLPVYLGWLYLGWMFFRDPPLITIAAGQFIVHRWPRRPLCIPLSNIRAVHIRHLPSDGEGRPYFIEFALHSHTLETQTFMESWLGRTWLRGLASSGVYSPPQEPFFLLQTPYLRATDAELVDAVFSQPMEAAT
jgi:hypothetical protein